MSHFHTSQDIMIPHIHDRFKHFQEDVQSCLIDSQDINNMQNKIDVAHLVSSLGAQLLNIKLPDSQEALIDGNLLQNDVLLKILLFSAANNFLGL